MKLLDIRQWIFQEYLVPCHMTQSVKRWFAQNNFELLLLLENLSQFVLYLEFMYCICLNKRNTRENIDNIQKQLRKHWIHWNKIKELWKIVSFDILEGIKALQSC